MTIDTTQLEAHGMAQAASLSGPVAPLRGSTIDLATIEWNDEFVLLAQTTSILKVCQLAAANLGNSPVPGVDEAEEHNKNLRAVEFWTRLTSDEPGLVDQDEREYWQDELDQLPYDSAPGLREFGDDPTFFTDSRGVEDTIKVGEALRRVVTLAGIGLDRDNTLNAKDTGLFQVLQTEALLYRYSDRVGVFLNGCRF